ncbi:peptidoglycan DD-metalloendopeptidase family protein [Haliangium sp.]|uniref:peptidoglycan DD-metalloendopeptidase family protein n=1 Tax=Haliangium sp. TaxID=2663208 RepID=UPI003D152AB3
MSGWTYSFGGTTYETPDLLSRRAGWTLIERARPTFDSYQPFDDAKVTATNGWLYRGDGTMHASIDYVKDQNSFAIRAFAAGRVIFKGWHDWHGNVLILEHGPDVRSLYFHLRDGASGSWLNMAKAIDPSAYNDDPDPAVYDDFAKATRYQLYASAGHGGAAALGTDSHKIQVSRNRRVEARQVIAWAGNTGIGGASASLRADGTMARGVTNIHLHFMVAIRDGTRWFFIDPCGAYSKAPGCCADRGKGAYGRWFAPVTPAFHDWDAALWQQAHDHYHAMNWGPSDLQFHAGARGLRMSGVIRPRQEDQYVHHQMSLRTYDRRWGEYRGKGFRPHKQTVYVGGDGKPKITTIWRRARGEAWYSWRSLTGAQFDAKVAEMGRKGCRLTDFCVYPWSDGSHRVAAIWIADRRAHQVWWKLDRRAWQVKFDALSRAGYRLTHFDVCTFGSRTLFGGIWTKGMGTRWLHYAELSANAYQAKFDELSRQGWTLIEVRAYAHTRKFSGIWAKGVDPERHLG